MKPSLIIPRLRAQCPALANRVGGAAELAAAVDNKRDLATPCAFVLPEPPRVSDSVSAPSVVQLIDDVFGVVVIADATADLVGADAAETMADIQAELLAALVNWKPSAIYGPVRFDGADYIEVDRARLVAQFDFAARFILKGTA